jgi:hypothetical protein
MRNGAQEIIYPGCHRLLMFYSEKCSEYADLFCCQRYSWDCGVACCCMIMRWAGVDISYSLLLRCANLFCSRPCWTIDLVLLLHEWKIQVDMYTRFLGLNPDHAALPWYQTDSADNNLTSTLRKRFCSANFLGLTIHRKSLSSNKLKFLLADVNVSLLVLVSSSVLLHGIHER